MGLDEEREALPYRAGDPLASVVEAALGDDGEMTEEQRVRFAGGLIGRRRPHPGAPRPRVLDAPVGTAIPLPDGAGHRRRLDKRPDRRKRPTTNRDFPGNHHHDHSDPTSPRIHTPRGPP